MTLFCIFFFLFHFSFLYHNIILIHFFSSPQAIFKDPFRGGNNILVSASLHYKESNY